MTLPSGEVLGPGPLTSHLTVVIVTFNCGDLIAPCLQSIDAQRDRANTTIVVVDNASKDHTARLIEADFPWVDLVRMSHNTGFAVAANRGIGGARRGPVLLLNPDTVVHPGAIAEALEALDRWPSAAFVGCRLTKVDGTLDHACRRSFPTIGSAAVHLSRVGHLIRSRAAESSYVNPPGSEWQEGPVDAINGAFMMVRPEALDEIGMLDESFWMYGEDLDWCKRAWDAGWSVIYTPRATVTHIKGATSGKPRRLKPNYWFHRSMWKYFVLHDNGTRAVWPAVWLGIWVRFALSATSSWLVRAVRSVRDSARA